MGSKPPYTLVLFAAVIVKAAGSTVMAAGVADDARYAVPSLKLAPTWCVPVPTALGVYVAEHVLAELDSGTSVQLAVGVNEPDPSVEKVTVPVGATPLIDVVTVAW